VAATAAASLADGRIVGWFQGRMEIGPRALGGRSILADPRTRDMHVRVNQIKSREQWRPLAPSILVGQSTALLCQPAGSPYMLVRNSLTSPMADQVPAIVHIDGSVRPQIVSAVVQPVYHRLLESFDSQTGVPLVLNTSFNRAGEPLVCTPHDALEMFVTTGIDELILGPYVVRK
jgi:carbamoyltransferase